MPHIMGVIRTSRGNTDKDSSNSSNSSNGINGINAINKNNVVNIAKDITKNAEGALQSKQLL